MPIASAYVNDRADPEVGDHAQSGWGAPPASGNYGYTSTPHPDTFMMVWGPGDDDSDEAREATVDFDITGHSLETVTVCALDGIADDSYEIFVDGTSIGTYSDVYASDEVWVTKKYSHTVSNKVITVKIKATGAESGLRGTYGQLAVDWVTVTASNGDEGTVYLADVGSGGTYRWMDASYQLYGSDYQSFYTYAGSDVGVVVIYEEESAVLSGTLHAFNLKPNFCYQMKLDGYSGTPSNELLGLTGRWWRETWSGSGYTSGTNLNTKGDGTSPNPNDINYYKQRYDTTAPVDPGTGYHYKFTGYKVFDYFITDSLGNAWIDFTVDSSYHVLWNTTQRTHTSDDGPLKTSTHSEPHPVHPAYISSGYPSTPTTVFGEWERKPVGGTPLLSGEYSCNMVLTEESFHGGGLEGWWAAAMGGPMSFSITYNWHTTCDDELLADFDECFDGGAGEEVAIKGPAMGGGVYYKLTGLGKIGLGKYELEDFSDYDGDKLFIKNVGTGSISVCIFMNTGHTDPPKDWTYDTFWQSPWTSLGPGETVELKHDFGNSEAWNIADDPDYAGLSDGEKYAVFRKDEKSNLGFQVLGSGEAHIIVSCVDTSPFAIPEYPYGSIMAVLASLMGFMFLYARKSRQLIF
jgi:hypothetical protein